MYGIEYYSKAANLINDDKAKSSNKKVIKSNIITDEQHQQRDTAERVAKSSTNMNHNDKGVQDDLSLLTDQLAFKLQHLSKCPEYLIPRPVYTGHGNPTIATPQANSNGSLQSSLTSTIQSGKSTSSAGKYYTDDFILLSEFSEIEGPKPLLTIPTDGGTGFNKNEYSLHLMCVDFHSHLQPSPMSPSASFEQESDLNKTSCNVKSKFSLSRDTSIINYWDSATSVAACVHHFTLYDIEARGFVRPFCLAYVSYDRTKPVFFFDKIRQRFNEITDLFKKSNFNLFKRELEQRCIDLKYTKQIFIKWTARGEKYTDCDVDQMRLQVANELNLDQITCNRMNSSSIDEANISLQVNAIDNLSGELESVLSVVSEELKKKNWMMKTTRTSSNCIRDDKIKESEFQQMGELKNKTERSNTYPTVNDVMPARSRMSSKQPKIIKNILIGSYNANPSGSGGIDFFHLNQSENLVHNKTMRRLHQLSVHTAKQAINEMRLMQAYFNTPLYLLKFRELNRVDKTCKTCTDNNSGNANHFWSITLGNCVIDDFSTSIGVASLNKNSIIKRMDQSSYRIEHCSDLFPRNDAEVNDRNKLTVPDATNSIKPNISNSSGQTQFFSPISHGSNTRTNSMTATLNNNNYSHEVTANTTGYNNYDTVNEPSTSIEAGNQTKQASSSELFNTTPIMWENLENIFYDTIDDTTQLQDPNENDSDGEYFECSSECDYDLSDKETEYDFVNSLLDYKKVTSNRRTNNANNYNSYLPNGLTSCQSSSNVYAAYNRCKQQPNLTDTLIHMIEFNFEETLLQLANQYSTIFPHILYSLLKGRPIIVISRYCEDYTHLKSIVNTLSNFIPNSFHTLNELIESMSQQSETPKFTSSPCHLKQQSTKQKEALSSEKRDCKYALCSFHERQAIKLNDLKYCKLFGLTLLIAKDDECCSPLCNSGLVGNSSHTYFRHTHRHYHMPKSHDDTELLFKFIPITIRNYVSIFDLDKGTFLGPRYDGEHLLSSVQKLKSLKQDSICHLFLISHVVKYYLRTAFIYNYSILFDEDSEIFDFKRNRKVTMNSQCSMRSNKAACPNNLYGLRRERIIRYFSSNNNQYSQVLNNLNSTSESLFSFFGRSKSSSVNANNSRRGSMASSIASSLASSFISINDSDLMRSQFMQQNRPTAVQNDDLELLKLVLAVVNNNIDAKSAQSSGGSKSVMGFTQCDFNIVNNILKTLQTKQVYLYNLAMKRKYYKEQKVKREQRQAKGDPVDENGKVDESNFKVQIPLPLFVEYEKLTLF